LDPNTNRSPNPHQAEAKLEARSQALAQKEGALAQQSALAAERKAAKAF
jgi:hypothetical protein